jgi:hypothetical protein
MTNDCRTENHRTFSIPSASFLGWIDTEPSGQKNSFTVPLLSGLARIAPSESWIPEGRLASLLYDRDDCELWLDVSSVYYASPVHTGVLYARTMV